MPEEIIDEPDIIIEQLMAERKKRWELAFMVTLRTIKDLMNRCCSPLCNFIIRRTDNVPHSPALIKYLRSLKATKSIFLVTNGQEPDMLRRLDIENALPTEIYLSTHTFKQKNVL